MAWFQLNPSGDPTQPNDYSSNPSPTCDGTDQICAVQAEDDGTGHPVLTEPLKDEMIQALQFGNPSTNVQLRDA
ncbi:hypothetical protein [Sphingobacterium pedocola]|uniref:Uncharacterized protein n=1 Tax=Sphingobacterium pedocola TaxID=2082722 RepID=A0ABR9T7T6_9SPHI|nr:hypothetical protein [Sphingobacterium pedocola]MBE8721360.1 hypothetical protein [Sphingobacterium pedocola]